MDVTEGLVSGPRPGRMRDRRGRGRRGPLALPGPLSPSGVPVDASARQAFDDLVASVVRALAPAFAREAEPVDVVVEEVPILPEGWVDDVPLSSLVPATEAPTRLVLFRAPHVHRTVDDDDLADLVWVTVLDALAEVWHVSPDDLDPRP